MMNIRIYEHRDNLDLTMNIHRAYVQLILLQVETLHYDNREFSKLHNEQTRFVMDH